MSTALENSKHLLNNLTGCVLVALAVDAGPLASQPLSYKPHPHDPAQNAIGIGTLVHVPVGQKVLMGVIVGRNTHETSPPTHALKTIQAVVGKVDDATVACWQWLAQTLDVPLGKVLATVLPNFLLAPPQWEIDRVPGQSLNVQNQLSLKANSLTDDTHTLLQMLQAQKRWPVLEETLATKSPLSKAALITALQRLSKQGLITRQHRQRQEKPSPIRTERGPEGLLAPLPQLTPEQQAAYTAVSHHPPTDLTNDPWVLFGITGSGKTAVYSHWIADALNQGQNALFLLPEIALTGNLATRLQAHFGQRVLVWHSQQSASERQRIWQLLTAPKDTTGWLIVGARSAVLLPLPNLGVVIADEAHDGSYKQESPEPRYHALRVAEYRANQHGCPLILGSATPEVGQYQRAQQTHRLLHLTHRYGTAQLPTIVLADMRTGAQEAPPPLPPDVQTVLPDFRPQQHPLIHPKLQVALATNLARGQQSMILMNRRGYYTLVQCERCGTKMQCPHCAVNLTAHLAKTQPTEPTASPSLSMHCHHCHYTAPMVAYCPACASRQMTQSGIGNQRVLEALKTLFPTARLARLDTDLSNRKSQTRDVLAKFQNGELDILVGTQMIAKGLDIHNVTLVGVLQADTACDMPDLQASERGFQLLTQVAGRAGRGDKPGTVIFQVMNPEHPVVEKACTNDVEGFLRDELALRDALQFPPFATLCRLVFTGPHEAELAHLAQVATTDLQTTLPQQQPNLTPEALQLLGPAPCPVSKVQQRYRWQTLVSFPNTLLHHQEALMQATAHWRRDFIVRHPQLFWSDSPAQRPQLFWDWDVQTLL